MKLVIRPILCGALVVALVSARAWGYSAVSEGLTADPVRESLTRQFEEAAKHRPYRDFIQANHTQISKLTPTPQEEQLIKEIGKILKSNKNPTVGEVQAATREAQRRLKIHTDSASAMMICFGVTMIAYTLCKWRSDLKAEEDKRALEPESTQPGAATRTVK